MFPSGLLCFGSAGQLSDICGGGVVEESLLGGGAGGLFGALKDNGDHDVLLRALALIIFALWVINRSGLMGRRAYLRSGGWCSLASKWCLGQLLLGRAGAV